MRLDRIKVFTEAMKKDLTCKELANRAGVSKSTIYGIRSGRSCSLETAKKISGVLGVTIDDLKE